MATGTPPMGPSNSPGFTGLSIGPTVPVGHVEEQDAASHLETVPPHKIIRELASRNLGTIGEMQLDAGHPDAGFTRIPHQYIPRKPYNVDPYDKNIDVTVKVPAIFVGNPHR